MELKGKMDRCTGCCNITEIMLQIVLYTILSFDQDCELNG